MCFDLYGSSVNFNESTKTNFTNLEPSNRVAIFAAVMASICKGCSKIKFTNLNGHTAFIISPILDIFLSQKFPVFPAF